MTIPDWQLPPGVDRGLWDYLHAAYMVAAYDEQMRASPFAETDIAFCEKVFPTPGRLLDLGCGTGRLCRYFASRGYDCTGVDLSDEMLSKAKQNCEANRSPQRREERKDEMTAKAKQNCSDLQPFFVKANLVDLSELPQQSFDYAACLFSTLGMVRGHENRAKVIANAFRLLKPGGRFVLHVHNRYFRGLGLKRILGQAARSMLGKAGDIAMPQAYGGAPLTLYHFTQREAVRLLESSGFAGREVATIGVDGKAAWPWWRVYGWLILAERMR
jgi:SAM-dependent methyltransferase